MVLALMVLAIEFNGISHIVFKLFKPVAKLAYI